MDMDALEILISIPRIIASLSLTDSQNRRGRLCLLTRGFALVMPKYR